MRKNKMLAISVFLIGLALMGVGFFNRVAIQDAFFSLRQPTLSKAPLYGGFVENASATPLTTPQENQKNYQPKSHDREIWVDKKIIPAQINLAVPFTPQAPHANWALPYQEACEEASLLMVARYKNGQAIASPEDADQEILKLVEFQNNFFGYYKDTTAEETAKIAREYYGFQNTEVLYDFTIDDIKRAVAEGNPVIVPAAGRLLPNPYFTSPGPLYHMLVVRGYTDTHFITNDPGTRRGEEFLYTYDELLNAAHDWNGGDVENGQSVMIVVK